MATKKIPTKQAVQYAAELLIEKNGKTTTLEVKTLLQSMGYFAEQREISKHVGNIVIENKKFSILSDNGTYRTYGFANTATKTHTTSASANGNSQRSRSNRGAKRRVFLSVVSRNAANMKKANIKSDNWIVFDKNQSAPPFVYNSYEDRSQVLTHYASENGVNYHDVRAKRAERFFA